MKIRKAITSDISELVKLMVQFNEYFEYDTNKSRIIQSLQQFLANDQLGECYVIQENGLVGYGVLTYGFSFEYGGRDAFIDEIFVQSDLRGKGYGEKLMDELMIVAKKNGVNALHLEVEKNNDQAAALYEKYDFFFSGRILRTKLLNKVDDEIEWNDKGGLPDQDLKGFLGCGG